MNVGFFIKALILTGVERKPARIDFTTGLNVIAGASDTGKTFIFQCIDFMLGGQRSPKPIAESRGYERVFLVISTYEGESFTLQRTTTGGPFQIKEGDENSSMPYENYREQLANDPKNISTFLLSLCNLENIVLKRNAQNAKARLSFRDVAGLSLVDEKTIISEDSPVYQSGESVARTKEQSLFYYFLVGEDATSLVEFESPKLLKSKIAGKIELIEELIKRTQTKLDQFKGENVEELEKNLDEQYERLNLEYRTSISEIDRLRNQKASYFKNLERLESKMLFNKELIERFDLLEKHYVNDRKRLEFILEGNFLLNQLNSVNCPICETELNEEHSEHLLGFQRDNENFEQSLTSELQKITLKQTELTQTLTQLKEDNAKKKKSIEKVKEKILAIVESLNNSLTPVSQSLKERLQALSELKVRLERYKNLKNEIESYNDQLNGLYLLSEKKVESNEIALAQYQQAFRDFCSTIESILNSWQYPNITSLTFDGKFKVFDILINNNPRSTNGKGYRAITYSAFVYGLMKYSQNKGRNHPNLIVLDSPLTTFKERDGSVESQEEVSKDIEYAFFESLSEAGDNEQIIILENKEPNESLVYKMNYIHFSGQKGVGREGFF